VDELERLFIKWLRSSTINHDMWSKVTTQEEWQAAEDYKQNIVLTDRIALLDRARAMHLPGLEEAYLALRAH
jgi:hypothetical protein